MATDQSARRVLPPIRASCHAAGVAGRIPVVIDPHCADHDPQAEIWLGVRTPAAEIAERVATIESSLRELGHQIVAAREFDDAWLTRVHSADLLEHLASVWDQWVDGGYPDLGAQRVVPYLFPSAELLHGLPIRPPAALHAQVGAFCYDTMTLIGPGSWRAIRAATHATRTAVELVAAGARAAYALTRPPGHHATRSAYGGSCYLNNAAIAAQALRDNGFATVAVVDVDAHHGNGTQAIFYERADVFTASVHVDPGAGWFPHYVGFADETGRDAGRGANLNRPLAPGSGDRDWLGAVTHVVDAVAASDATALVVALGVDAAVDDPESPLQVTVEGYRRAGSALAALGLPTVVVQEGGYHLPTLGQLVGSALDGLGSG
ncbi:histone deacetylase family protein [Mycolicibacterium moriokaense]|nr:histone deacetylase family protein [Mycolicibacterium moriokaense]